MVGPAGRQMPTCLITLCAVAHRRSLLHPPLLPSLGAKRSGAAPPRTLDVSTNSVVPVSHSYLSSAGFLSHHSQGEVGCCRA